MTHLQFVKSCLKTVAEYATVPGPCRLARANFMATYESLKRPLFIPVSYSIYLFQIGSRFKKYKLRTDLTHVQATAHVMSLNKKYRVNLIEKY